MYLGIEIGGTKLQLGVGAGDGALAALERRPIEASRGAGRILEQIKEVAVGLIADHAIDRVGFGFGGPVDTESGVVTKSHQVEGWDGVPLADWCRRELQRAAVVANDCDMAALAEARFGAGQGKGIVFYVTIGTGIGGGLVIDGRLHGEHRPSAAEIGHLRPNCLEDTTVESLASGPAIAAAVRRTIAERPADADVKSLVEVCQGDLERLTTKTLAEVAATGNPVAIAAFGSAANVLGWAVAQTITLVAPQTVVLGGGVSLTDAALFLDPVREAANRHVFAPLADSYEIVPAKLGEEVVVHGALARAAEQD